MLTYQDFLVSTDKEQFILDAINEYKSSDAYEKAIEAEAYFKAENTCIINRPKWKMTKSGKEVTFSQNIVVSDFFFRFAVQQNQYLLANGMEIEDSEKKKMGMTFDKTLESIGERAIIHGVCWGFWNLDHLEMFEAVKDDGAKGFFVLFDEENGDPKIGIRYWQIDPLKPVYIELYEIDGITKYIAINNVMFVREEKKAYVRTIRKDSISSEIVNAQNYDVLPIIPLYANEYGRSEFKRSIKTKIDLYDKIFSDFGDNLERTNDIYWVISNFGGTTDEIKMMLAEIEELRATYSTSDGTGNSTATPLTVEVPYAARQVALDLLEKALYKDYMAMNMDEIRGGSLTNVAIKTARANLEMKVNRYEWQVFQFCQKVLKLAGIETENIKFTRQYIANEEEMMNMLYTCRDDLDYQTALEKNPMIEMDEVDPIMKRKALEDTGVPEDDESDDDE